MDDFTERVWRLKVGSGSGNGVVHERLVPPIIVVDHSADNPVLPPHPDRFVRPDTHPEDHFMKDEKSQLSEWVRAICMVAVFLCLMFAILFSLVEDAASQEVSPDAPPVPPQRLPATILEMLGANPVEQPTTFTFIRLYGAMPKSFLPQENKEN